MRKPYQTLTLSVALVVAAGGVALGQSAGSPDPMRPGTATITVVDMRLVSPGILRPDDASMVYTEQGRNMTMTWQSSDSRLSGEVASAADRAMLRDGSIVESETFELVNDDGRWVGESLGLSVPAAPASGSPIISLPVSSEASRPEPLVDSDTVLLRGEGAYEGLSALTSIDWRQDPPLINAVIFTGGPLSE